MVKRITDWTSLRSSTWKVTQTVTVISSPEPLAHGELFTVIV